MLNPRKMSCSLPTRANWPNVIPHELVKLICIVCPSVFFSSATPQVARPGSWPASRGDTSAGTENARPQTQPAAETQHERVFVPGMLVSHAGSPAGS